MGRRILRLVIIAVVTIALTLIGFEIVVRAIPLYPDRMAQPNPLYGWEYPANGSGTWLNAGCPREFVNTVRFNSHGLHDVERTYDRPDGVRRVMLLGDSMVAALELPVEQILPRLLEADLNADLADPHTYEVVAVGHQGYGVDLSLRYYEEVAHQFQPDLIVFVMQPHNDITDNHPPMRSNAFVFPAPHYTLNDDGTLTLNPVTAYQPTLADTLRGLSKGYALLELRLWLRSLPTDQQVVDPAVAAERQRIYDEQYAIAWRLTFTLFAALRDRAAADGAELAVIMDRSAVPAGFVEDLHAGISEELDALGIPNLSLLPVLDAANTAETPVIFPCDRHWTAYGHQVVAEAVTPFVRAQFDE